jgi:ribose/xylose/arabinose/galactoside ABC-type transport system permease subunit
MAAKALRPDDLRKWLPLATLAALILMIGIAQPSFLQPSTLIELASDTAVLFILATGVTFVIMLGGIDLSIQSLLSRSLDWATGRFCSRSSLARSPDSSRESCTCA